MTADSVSASRGDESFRGTAIIAYVLYLLGWPSLHLATIVALILAYVQRGDARGTIWESHFTNVIETFWISLIVGIVAIPLCFVGIGFVVLAFLLVWFLYRTIKGLIRAIDGRPYV
jgi:uncharacterized membrane protein